MLTRLLPLGLLALVATASATEPMAAVDFRRDIRPILSDNCFLCHGPDAGTREADLRLDTSAGAMTVLAAGDSAASEMIRRITSSDPDEQMPPADFNRKLSHEQIELLRRWVDEGAAWDEHWSFAPLNKPPVPAAHAQPPATLRNPIDAFVQSRLGERQRPAPEADRETLIRRVTLDLTGFPPNADEVEAFLSDQDPLAYETLIDRLLQSPAFGERMAWDWLDAARYADSNGYQGDGERTMWPWRDWVVDAFNRNLPYDQFTVWQLAGDLLPDATFEQKLASAFSRNHMINGEGGRIAEENRVEYVMDMSETMGTVWLGLTLNCCRCHDHKFDPLTQRDYYQLFAFFNQTPVNGGGGSPQTAPILPAPTQDQTNDIAGAEQLAMMLAAQRNERAAALSGSQSDWEAATLAGQDGQPEPEPDSEQAKLNAILRKPVADRTAEETERVRAAHRKSDSAYQDLERQRAKQEDLLKALRGAVPKVMVMEDLPTPRKSYILDRGLYNKPADEVTANTPAFLPPLAEGEPANRLGLARWLVTDQNPLTARVTVNRLWQQLFGTGLVKTTEDFGAQGEIPPHWELLDWLAAEFQRDWDVKRLMRLIVTSHTYRQSSRTVSSDGSPSEIRLNDPENRLLARGPRCRLPSWMLRDQALAAGGLLVANQRGPSVNGYQPAGVWEEATFGNKRYRQDHGASLYRRSLYTFWRRIIGPTMFFDNASRQVCTVKPYRTNTPLHALLTLNDVTYVEAARSLAELVLTDSGTATGQATDEERLDHAFRRLLARPASTEERTILLLGLQRSHQAFQADTAMASELLAIGESSRNDRLDPVQHASWTALCLALLNLDETLTKE